MSKHCQTWNLLERSGGKSRFRSDTYKESGVKLSGLPHLLLWGLKGDVMWVDLLLVAFGKPWQNQGHLPHTQMPLNITALEESFAIVVIATKGLQALYLGLVTDLCQVSCSQSGIDAGACEPR